MKKYPIRIGIYETNSSSSHSFSLGPRGRLAKTIEMSEEGTIEVSTGSWEGYEKFNDPLLKLSYLLCYVYTVYWEEDDEDSKKDYYKLQNEIIEVVKDFTGAVKVIVDIDEHCLIDHQSVDIIDFRYLKESEFIREFIFNPSTWVYAIWDSYEPEEDFFEPIDSPLLYTIHLILPGIEKDVTLEVKYRDTTYIKEKIDFLLINYYWSGERFYEKGVDTIESWYLPCTSDMLFGENKKIEFTITFPSNDN